MPRVGRLDTECFGYDPIEFFIGTGGLFELVKQLIEWHGEITGLRLNDCGPGLWDCGVCRKVGLTSQFVSEERGDKN